MKDTGMMTESWGKLIVDQLIKQGVTYFCIAPGSRSTPLAAAVAAHPLAESIVHFDERGIAFHALGYGKATGKPAAIIVTSGTAVGNLFPAIMEASLSFTPLIALTSDRPSELRDIGSNQTLDQVKIFGDYVRWQIDLAPPCAELQESYVSGAIDHAVFAAQSGPVQLNCQFREPFFGAQEASPTLKTFPKAEQALLRLAPERAKEIAKELSQFKSGLIVIGEGLKATSFEAVDRLAEKLGWPIVCDIASGARSEGAKENRISYYDLILKTENLSNPEAVLHIGERFVSKTLLEWLAPKHYYLVTPYPFRFDPKYRVTHRLQADPIAFCQDLLPHIASSASCLEPWKSKAAAIEERLQEYFKPENALSEPGLFHFLKENLSKRWALFLAASMPIRDGEMFLFPKERTGPIFANRGVSGIDGTIATAIGIGQGSGMPTLAVIGDQAALHDINSLAQLSKCKVPVVILIINNGGGGIFSFLPVAQKKQFCEEYVAAAHTFTFEHAARLFHIPYFHAASKESWEELASRCLAAEQSALIEVPTNREQNYALHQQITQMLTQTPAAR